MSTFKLMKKTIFKKLVLNLKAGQASIGAQISSILGALRVNVANFVKEYNEKSKNQIGFIVPAKVTVFSDRSYGLKLKTPLTSSLLKKNMNLIEDQNNYEGNIVANISKENIEKIAKIKLPDLNTNNIYKAISIILGTARNMGISILTTL